MVSFDCAIVGGGIAGLQAAVQLGRYQHRVFIVDAGEGRSTLCRCYHNLLGWPNGVSGMKLRDLGKTQALHLGVHYLEANVIRIIKNEENFVLITQEGTRYFAKRILLATGIVDRIPLPELFPCLGICVYVCPDCDGYEVKNRPVLVMGSGNTGANMAITLKYWTSEIIYINHEKTPVDFSLQNDLIRAGIPYVENSIERILRNGEQFHGVLCENGEQYLAECAFVAFGGNQVKSELAKQLGVQVLDNLHIAVDPRTKMTNIQHVYAAGDVVAHSEQVSISMGDGAQAAIWIHKSLME